MFWRILKKIEVLNKFEILKKFEVLKNFDEIWIFEDNLKFWANIESNSPGGWVAGSAWNKTISVQPVIFAKRQPRSLVKASK